MNDLEIKKRDSHTYSLRYNIDIQADEKGYKKKDAGEYGLTDCLVVISKILSSDGSSSQKIIMAYNGKEKRSFTDNELFKVWMTLGLELHDRQMLKGWKAHITEAFATTIRTLFKNSTSEN